MPRTFLSIALLGLVLAPPAAARAVLIMPGVTYEHRLEWTSPGVVQLYVITAPRPGGLYSVGPLLSNDSVTGRETVSSMERRASTAMTTIGVNGDFFDWKGGWPTGLLMQGGVVEHHPADQRSAVGVDSSGTLHVDRVPWSASWSGSSSVTYPITRINEPPLPNSTSLFTPVWGASTPEANGTVEAVLGPFPPLLPFRDLVGGVSSVVQTGGVPIPRDGAVLVARGGAAASLLADALPAGQIKVQVTLPQSWATVTEAVGGGPALVRNGSPIANAGEALTPAQLYGRDPRTAIGQRADGRIVIVAADGRRPGWSVGISNWDLALTLMRYGCVNGFALDSGGSTTVAFDGQLLNRPSDPTGERPVGEALVVGYTGVFAPAPAPTLSPNRDGVAESESLAYKLVRPSTVSAKLVAPDGTVRELDAGPRNPGWYRFSWDGTAADGTPAPEGQWRWSVTATDDLGRASKADRAFAVDRTLGFVRVRPAVFRRGRLTTSFDLTRDAKVRVSIEDLSGDILRTVEAKPLAAGRYAFAWKGRDGRGHRVRSGTYIVRVAATSAIGLSEVRVPIRVKR
jgi:hypothetical protein